VYNGSEFVSEQLDMWAYAHGVKLDFSRLRKPTDDAVIESFNGRFRDECLDVHWFESLEDARTKIDAWRRDYPDERCSQGSQTLSRDGPEMPGPSGGSLRPSRVGQRA
jgi:putative transposase